jgi:transcriptional regulator with XRE-family HTH domain
VTDHGVALALEDVPWASKQLWAPDAAAKDGRYYLYFPARDKDGIFRIGVAVGDAPEGPFVADPHPIGGTYSIDPCSFVDDNGQAYLYFGGIWGGQLQCWKSDAFDPSGAEPTGDAPALMPRVARLSDDMRSLQSEVREVALLDEGGQPLRADDRDRRFFEAAWMHKKDGVYYFLTPPGTRTTWCTLQAIIRSALHLPGPYFRAGTRLDNASFDRRIRGEMVPVPPRYIAVGREEPSALRQSRGAFLRHRWGDTSHDTLTLGRISCPYVFPSQASILGKTHLCLRKTPIHLLKIRQQIKDNPAYTIALSCRLRGDVTGTMLPGQRERLVLKEIKMNYLTFGEWLRHKRKVSGLSQTNLGERVGLTQLQVSRLESGLQRATGDVVRPLIEVLEVDPAEAASWLDCLDPVRKPAPKPSLYPSRQAVAKSSKMGGAGSLTSEKPARF